MLSKYSKLYDGNAKKFGRVVVLYGGTSAEREVSLLSGRAVATALKSAGVDCELLDLQGDPCKALCATKMDMVFIALHGVGGEDGKIQALLDLMGIPYTGSRHAASALAMDKWRTKLVWQSVGLPTPKFEMLSENSDWQTLISEFPEGVFVKPVHEGSSIGVSRASTAEEMKAAYSAARKYERLVMAESWVHGAELSVSILGRQSLPSIQLQVAGQFYDYDAKYISDKTKYICPAPISAEQEEQIGRLALTAFESLGCCIWGRVDFMQDSSGALYLIEANTVPGMTSHSLVPMAAKAAGMNFEEVVCEILELTYREAGK